jgi:protein-tyrosine phosphatase
VPPNFTWIVEKRVAATSAPRNEADHRWLKAQGVDHLIRLHDEQALRVYGRHVTRAGLSDAYFPMPDGTAPSVDRLKAIIMNALERLNQDKSVAVQCLAGYGRTGTAIAGILISQGATVDDALSNLIAKRPGCQEVLRIPEQHAALRTLAAEIVAAPNVFPRLRNPLL